MEHPCQAADCSGVSHRGTLSVPSLAKCPEQILHPCDQVRLRCLQEQMENLPAVALREGWVVAHQHPGMDTPAVAPANLTPKRFVGFACVTHCVNRTPNIAVRGGE